MANGGWRKRLLSRMLAAVVVVGSFDGLAHAPRRHGVQLVCGMSPGHSGGRRPPVLIDRLLNLGSF